MSYLDPDQKYRRKLAMGVVLGVVFSFILVTVWLVTKWKAQPILIGPWGQVIEDRSVVGLICGLSVIGLALSFLGYMVYWWFTMTPDQRQEWFMEYQREQKERAEKNAIKKREAELGTVNPLLECPHCHAVGGVYTKPVKKGQGVSGSKLTAAWLTGGWSILVAGLSRNESMLQCFCERCTVRWHIG